jgi:hypothetical protein
MAMNSVKNLCAMGLACMAGSAAAQPLEFTIDPAQSSLDLSIEIDLGGLGGDTDSDSTALSGLIVASFDDPEAASESSLHDFQAMMDSDLNYNWTPAFLSTADATMTGGVVEYATPGVIQGPVPVIGGGFEFPAVPVTLGGILTVNYNIFLVGSGSQVVDLSTLEPGDTPINGTVSVDGSMVTISNSIEFSGSQPLIVEGSEVGQVIFTGSATMIAVAELPSCPADITGDGQLNFLDVSAFLAAFGVQDSVADMNMDGQYNFLDVSAYLAAFGNGCP